MEPISIPARRLGLLNMPDFCPRCFWLKLHLQEKFPFQIPMPGIFSSLDAYGKKIIHSYFDKNQTLPQWFPFIGEVRGYIRKLSYKTFFYEEPNTKITLTGTPDDIFKLSDDSYFVVDYKTAKHTEKQDSLFPLYEVQTNVYAFVAQKIGLSPISGIGLVYMEPVTDFDERDLSGLTDNDNYILKFSAHLKNVEIQLDNLLIPLLKKARDIFEIDQIPERKETCKDCNLMDVLLSKLQ